MGTPFDLNLYVRKRWLSSQRRRVHSTTHVLMPHISSHLFVNSRLNAYQGKRIYQTRPLCLLDRENLRSEFLTIQRRVVRYNIMCYSFSGVRYNIYAEWVLSCNGPNFRESVKKVFPECRIRSTSSDFWQWNLEISKLQTIIIISKYLVIYDILLYL